MTRFETKEDLDRETKVLYEVENVTGLCGKKLHDYDRIDYCLVSTRTLENENIIKYWIEIKCRMCDHDTYKTLKVSMKKCIAGLELMEYTGIPFSLVIGYYDGIYAYQFKPDSVLGPITWGGRTKDKRREADIEPMLHIPIEKLERLSELNVHGQGQGK